MGESVCIYQMLTKGGEGQYRGPVNQNIKIAKFVYRWSHFCLCRSSRVVQGSSVSVYEILSWYSHEMP